MLALLYVDKTTAKWYDETYADRHIRMISPSAWSLWQKLKRLAREWSGNTVGARHSQRRDFLPS